MLKHRKCFCSIHIENAFAAERRVTNGRTHRLTEFIYRTPKWEQRIIILWECKVHTFTQNAFGYQYSMGLSSIKCGYA